MSATVSNVAPSEFINGSDMLYALQSVQGQLWERVAEGRVINYGAYPWKMLSAVERFNDESVRPVCIAGMGFKGILGRHVCGDHHSHGIIRAGERVK